LGSGRLEKIGKDFVGASFSFTIFYNLLEIMFYLKRMKRIGKNSAGVAFLL